MVSWTYHKVSGSTTDPRASHLLGDSVLIHQEQESEIVMLNVENQRITELSIENRRLKDKLDKSRKLVWICLGGWFVAVVLLF